MLGRPVIVGPRGPVLLDPDRHRSVCIVLLSGIGDVVHGLPLAHDVKRVDSGIHVCWVAEPAPAEVLRNHPAVDRIVVYRSRDGLKGLAELRSRMRDVRSDLTVNAQRYLKSAWPTVLSGAPVRVGLPLSKTRDGIRFAHTHVLHDGPWKHTQDLFLDFRWALGADRDAPLRWEITFSHEERAEQAAFFGSLGSRPTVGLVVASANPRKDWSAERQARLADALSSEYGYRVLLLGGPSETERRAARTVMERCDCDPVDQVGDGVRKLMWTVAGCDLAIAPDTGPLHIAHALGVPVVGLFGHTNPWRVGPYSRFRDLVVDAYTDPGAEPDPSAYLSKDDRMETITVEDVLAKVEVARSRYR